MEKKQIQISNHQFQLFQEPQRQHMPVFMKNLTTNKFFFWDCFFFFFARKLKVVLDMYLILLITIGSNSQLFSN
jgi:hypothetical protein